MAGEIYIEPCDSANLRHALALVLRTLPADQRAPLVDSLSKLADEPLGAFQALWVARQCAERGASRIVAAAWGQPQPGRGCSLWPPQCEHGDPSLDLATELIHHVTRVADKVGIAVTQTLAEQRYGPMHTPLVSCGFVELAELRYLHWTPRPVQTPPSAASVEFEPIDPRDPLRLERLTCRTYVDTLDFPELDGMRDIRDVLHGYRAVGEHDPGLWELLRVDGADVGVLLMTDHPDTRQLELMYVGVVPEARGRGVGAAAVARAQRTAHERRSTRLVLAVDARNEPALEIYHRAGLREWARRYAYLRKNGAAEAVR